MSGQWVTTDRHARYSHGCPVHKPHWSAAFHLALRAELALENLALRQQLANLRHTSGRPRIRMADRAFWLVLSRLPFLFRRRAGQAFGRKVLKSGQQAVESLPCTQALSLLTLFAKGDSASLLGRLFHFGPPIIPPDIPAPRCMQDRAHEEQSGPSFCSELGMWRGGEKPTSPSGR